MQDLDSLPLPRYNDEKNVYVLGDVGYDREVRLSILTTRGCFFNCSYCYNHICSDICRGLGKYLRRRSVDDVIGQIEDLRTRFKKLRAVSMSDSIFTYDHEWIYDWCKKFPSDMTFRCYGHFTMLDEGMLWNLKNAGCEMITVGYQHGSPRMRNEVFCRPETDEQILRGSELLAKVGIPVRYDKIIECPYETKEDKRKDVDLTRQLTKPFTLREFPLMNHPKGKLTTQLLRDGLISQDQVEGNCATAYKDAGAYNYHAIDGSIYPVTWSGVEYEVNQLRSQN